MAKKIIFPAALLAGISLLSACMSLGKGDDFSAYSPVALVTVNSNQEIEWYDEEGGEVSSSGLDIFGSFNKKETTRTTASTTDALVSAAAAILRENLEGSGIADFMAKDSVLQSRAYGQAEVSRRMEQNGIISAGGYKLIDAGNKQFVTDFSAETGAKSCMFVSFHFSKVVAFGVIGSGSYRGRVEMKVLIRDQQGKTIYNKTHTAKSEDTAKVAFGKYEESELMELLESAVSDACAEFVSQFGRIP